MVIRDLERTVLARQPRRRAGLGKADVSPVADVTLGRCKIIEPRIAGEQGYDLAIAPIRRQRRFAISGCANAARADDRFGVADGFGDLGRHQRQLDDVMPAVDILRRSGTAARCAAT